jgi:flagellin
MALIINTNTAALNAQRNLGVNNNALTKSLERLSSGLRINRAGDDAAGMAIATKMQSQWKGMSVAIRNANDAISLVQTAEGALNTVTTILQRLRELAVQAASDTNTAADRATLTSEADQLVEELSRTANTSEFNKKSLLDGTFSSGKLQVGANADQTISFSLGDARASQLGKRATVTSNIYDGVVDGGKNGNFTVGEFSLNGENVASTQSTDDQLSVLEIAGSNYGRPTAASDALSLSANALYINGTAIGAIAAGTHNSWASFVVALKTAINTASIANVTARNNTTGDAMILVAKKGVDLDVWMSGTTGFGSGTTASGILSGAFNLGSYISTGLGSNATYTLYNGQSSAIAKAAAINSVKSKTMVSASAEPNVVTGSAALTAGTISANTFYLNGVAVGNSFTITAGDSTGALVAAINAVSSDSGVTASISNNKLVLTASDGRNISVFYEGSLLNLPSAATVDGGTVYRSGVTLKSEDNITLSGDVAGLGSDISATTYQTNLNNAISLLDISTQSGANNAILSVDAALTQINALRADIGSVQSRLENTVFNLQISVENVTAAESRIRDADFAFETTMFTRNQIMVQAGTSILTQANTLPQLALTLLSGR